MLGPVVRIVTLNYKQLFLNIFDEEIQNHVLCFNIIAKILFNQTKH
jgi:hypothetical protein